MKKLIVLIVAFGLLLNTPILALAVPAIISPSNKTKLTDTTVTFSWDADGYTYFKFYAGDHISSFETESFTDTSRTVSAIPDDGSPVFVKLIYWDGSEWITINYFYQAPGEGAKLPSIVSPESGADLPSSSQVFQWDFGDYKVDNWTSFIFTLGSSRFAADIFEGETTAGDSVTVTNLPKDNSLLYATLQYWDGLTWLNIDQTYVSKKFPWNMFLPAITTQHECSLGYLGLCNDQNSCEAIGGYWWSERCNSTTQPECSLEHLDLCTAQVTCEAINAYWWGSQCNENMSVNQAYMARLAGYVTFHYVISDIEWTEHYYFDINTLREMDSETGYFWISGVDDYGYTVDVREYGIGGSYFFINEGFPTVDERFQFWIDVSGNVTGNFRVKDKEDSFYSGTDIGADLYGGHSETSFPQ